MDYFSRMCGDCKHLDDTPDVIGGREVTRCRHSLHVVMMPTRQGPGFIACFAEVGRAFPACSHFLEKPQGSGMPPTSVPALGSSQILLAS